MKSICLLFSFLMLSVLNIFASDLEAYVTINRFFQPDTKQHYVEVSYMVPTQLFSFKQNENNLFQAKLKVNIVLSKGGKLVNSQNYILESTEFKDLNIANYIMKDVVRISAPINDTLELSIEIEDVNVVDFKYESTVDIFIPETKDVFISDIMLVNKVEETNIETPFNRNNIYVLPKFLNYYPTEITEIKFYCEFYQINKEDNYFVRYLLTDEEGVYIDGYASFNRIEKMQYKPIISGFNIEKLPSGNYYLFVELKDSKNNIVERKRTFFQRNNKSNITVENIHSQKDELAVITNNFAKKYDLENIRHHTLALAPIAGVFERATIESFRNSDDLEQMQNYFFSFWKSKNIKDPEAEWMVYAKKLQHVENTFTTLSNRGFETSRGSLYLTYGEPQHTQLHRDDNIGEFWVWNYERLNGEGNVFFIFTNTDNITDDFKLVHTTLKGEVYDKFWAEYIKNEL